LGIPADAEHDVTPLLPQPLIERLTAEFAITMDGLPHPVRWHRQGGREHLLLIRQRARAGMRQNNPCQKKGASAKSRADDEDMLPMPQSQTVDDQADPLPAQPRRALRITGLKWMSGVIRMLVTRRSRRCAFRSWSWAGASPARCVRARTTR